MRLRMKYLVLLWPFALAWQLRRSRAMLLPLSQALLLKTAVSPLPFIGSFVLCCNYMYQLSLAVHKQGKCVGVYRLHNLYGCY